MVVPSYMADSLKQKRELLLIELRQAMKRLRDREQRRSRKTYDPLIKNQREHLSSSGANAPHRDECGLTAHAIFTFLS